MTNTSCHVIYHDVAMFNSLELNEGMNLKKSLYIILS